jgi:NAD-dependent dihydropyrimidine dehydrogenase PreA subunit
MSELPMVDDRLCTGCGDCVAVCPTECLALADMLPWLRRPVDCIACTLCVLLCPDEALRMVPSDEA